ncbi:Arginyl-tRNA--protein transferase 1 [Liparis tanakae]|uniref:Arginyl-tRNA--protein transferase 1 n=1 Tax=Liparis tanakae TaxID=230148 RepID=A0A4Z2EX77_9TELE|nr:Arginyl-tRNA--protein transferase 1 [Liparis tanakae]
MAANKSHTIVEYFGGDSGMWSHSMTVQDYQHLIDRGWRRGVVVSVSLALSGKYVYKPTLDKTCCPQYTIRCHALKFQPSKSHKKVLKKMSKFLSNGELPAGQEDAPRLVSVSRRVLEAALCLAGEPMDSLCGEAAPREESHACRPEVTPAAIADIQQEVPENPVITGAQQEGPENLPITGAQQEGPENPVITGAQQEGPDDSQTSMKDPESVAAERTTAAAPQAGRGADPGRPPSRKAKDLRKERRLQKEVGRHGEGDAPPAAAPKALEDFLREAQPDGAPHRLEEPSGGTASLASSASAAFGFTRPESPGSGDFTVFMCSEESWPEPRQAHHTDRVALPADDRRTAAPGGEAVTDPWLHQGSTRAPPELHQSSTRAPPELHQSIYMQRLSLLKPI